jgi:putative DNA primase/helicase
MADKWDARAKATMGNAREAMGDAQTDAERATVHRGQVRMAYQLADQFASKLMHVHGLGWFAWDGKRWAEDRTGEATKAVLDVLRGALADSLDDKDLRVDVRKCESAAGISGVLNIAAKLEAFAAVVDGLDADPYLLNCQNGTLDLRTLELRPADPADKVTKVTGAGYQPDARGAAWDAFLERVLPNEAVRGFAQRYVGMALCGRVLEHKLAIFNGIGRNGKGVFYGGVNDALGEYASAAEPDLFMHREGAHPTGEMDLRGLRFVVVSESDRGRRLAEATVKRLTGGDQIRARRMRQDFVAFTPSHTAALVTNHLPKVSGDDHALWERLRVIPFEVVIPPEEQDTHLPERLELETAAILAWLVDGWEQYRQIGLADPLEVRAATESYHHASDAITRFLDECCLVGPHLRVKVSDLWERWTRWLQDDGGEPISKRALGEELNKRGYAEFKGTAGTRFRKGLDLQGEEA